MSKHKWTSKIVGHERVPASQLLANPFNHRMHPQRQREVVAASIAELGFVKSVLVNKTTGHIVDGHERAMQALSHGDDTLVDVEYVELSVEDEKKALLILDASSELADVNETLAQQLIDDVVFESAAINAMLDDMVAAEDVEVVPQVEFAKELLLEHNYIVLVFDNALDWQVAVDKFGLKDVKSADSAEGCQKIGIGRVVKGSSVL